MQNSQQPPIDIENEIIPAGTIIGNDFEVLYHLAQGGMAHVYVALQRRVRRQIALKVLNRAFSYNQAVIDRFKIEAETLAKLEHPNTVKLHDVGQMSDGRLFIAMELLKGESLGSRIEKLHHIPIDDTCYIATQVAKSLAEAHSHGIIHRDLKPDNIFLLELENNFVKVLDFGIAKVKEENKQNKITQQGTVPGTPEYMSPEQARGHELDPRADIYSLGIVIYEMLAGNPPFSEPTFLATVLQHVQNPPPPLPDNIPLLLQNFILNRLLAKEKEQRPQSAEQFITELNNIQNQIKSHNKNNSDTNNLQLSKAMAEIESLRSKLANTEALLRSSENAIVSPLPQINESQTAPYYPQQPPQRQNQPYNHQPPLQRQTYKQPPQRQNQPYNHQPPLQRQTYKQPPQRQNQPYNPQIQHQNQPYNQQTPIQRPNSPLIQQPHTPIQRPSSQYPQHYYNQEQHALNRPFTQNPSFGNNPTTTPNQSQAQRPIQTHTHHNSNYQDNYNTQQKRHNETSPIPQRSTSMPPMINPKSSAITSDDDSDWGNINTPMPKRSKRCTHPDNDPIPAPEHIRTPLTPNKPHSRAKSAINNAIVQPDKTNPKQCFMTFATPIINIFGPSKIKEALSYAQGIWNASILGDEQRQIIIDQVYDSPKLLTLTNQMFARKIKIFHDCNWIIEDLRISKDTNNQLEIEFNITPP